MRRNRKRNVRSSKKVIRYRKRNIKRGVVLVVKNKKRKGRGKTR